MSKFLAQKISQVGCPRPSCVKASSHCSAAESTTNVEIERVEVITVQMHSHPPTVSLTSNSAQLLPAASEAYLLR